MSSIVWAFINQPLRIRATSSDSFSAVTGGIKYWNPDESVSGFIEGSISGSDMVTATAPANTFNVTGEWSIKSRILNGGKEYLGKRVRLQIYKREE